MVDISQFNHKDNISHNVDHVSDDTQVDQISNVSPNVKHEPLLSEVALVSVLNNVILFFVSVLLIIALGVTVTTSAKFIEEFNNLLLNLRLLP